MRFVLIRHGQSANNARYASTGSRLGRNPDATLTPLGHRQAARLAATLADASFPWRITSLHSSLMIRAIQTAAPVAEALDLPIAGDPELFEVGGPYQAGPGPDVAARVAHPGSGRQVLTGLTHRLVLPDRAGEHGWWLGPFESEAAGVERAGRVLARLRRGRPDDAVALVSHEWFTQLLLRELLGISSMTGWITIHNTAMCLVEDDGITVTVHRIDWLPHLDPRCPADLTC